MLRAKRKGLEGCLIWSLIEEFFLFAINQKIDPPPTLPTLHYKEIDP